MAKTTKKKIKVRIESDPLGEKAVPRGAYYGVQTERARENFDISGIPPRRELIIATAMIKRAAAEVNSELGLLSKKTARAIIRATDEIIRGGLHREFVVDVFQAGAGTSHNMNANEVIANRATELLGGRRGDYTVVHPNDHVNMAQSTNDTFPTAMKLSALMLSGGLTESLSGLERELKRKGRAFGRVIKSARTHLRDAVPITLGQEFASYAECIKKRRTRITEATGALKTLGIGGSAAGTGLNTHPRYRRMVVRALSRSSGIRGLKPAPDTVEAMNSMAPFVDLSGALRALAVELIRIANDLRLLSSGPRTGLSEITLPAVQPGSSIMPGKANPVMAEMLNMVSFQVVGNDLTIAMASQAGQLELNVMMPVISHNLLQSMDILTGGMRAFTERCVTGIEADRERCREYFERSIGLATVLNPIIGYGNAATVARAAVERGVTLRELIAEKGLLSEEELDRLLDPATVTGPQLKKMKRRV
ncbi:MAG: aspartate ammonia-lyase [Thermodesulfobacteriota bacterium]